MILFSVLSVKLHTKLGRLHTKLGRLHTKLGRFYNKFYTKIYTKIILKIILKLYYILTLHLKTLSTSQITPKYVIIKLQTNY